jgi:hypothetical protein
LEEMKDLIITILPCLLGFDPMRFRMASCLTPFYRC